jgi:hypothetical protein
MGRRKTEEEREEEREAEIARRFVKIREKRREELARRPLLNLPSLIQQIKAMREHLDRVSDDGEIEYTADDIDTLQTCQLECALLRGMIDIMLNDFMCGDVDRSTPRR